MIVIWALKKMCAFEYRKLRENNRRKKLHHIYWCIGMIIVNFSFKWDQIIIHTHSHVLREKGREKGFFSIRTILLT